MQGIANGRFFLEEVGHDGIAVCGMTEGRETPQDVTAVFRIRRNDSEKGGPL